MNLEYNIFNYIYTMFCKICQNFMDITNNVGAGLRKQLGGDNDEDLSSSDFDVSISDSQSASILDIVEKFKGGSDTESDLKKLDLSDLTKNPEFNKLSNAQKSLVINKINVEQDNLDKLLKPVDSVVSKECYFLCKTCGYYEIIPEKMFIFSRGDEKKDDIYNFNFVQYKNDPTIPNTKKYICINDKCTTHNKPELKDAVFYRQKGSYTVRYICKICDSFWDTFIEK